MSDSAITPAFKGVAGSGGGFGRHDKTANGDRTAGFTGGEISYGAVRSIV